LKKSKKNGNIVNYFKHLEIKISEGKGRGLFATKAFKRGELILVEKATVETKNDI